MGDYYNILGVQKTASEKELKKAYRKQSLSILINPSEGAKDKFQEINEAYAVLSDQDKERYMTDMVKLSLKKIMGLAGV